VGSELPAVIVDIMRGGPGLGNIAPAQGDYFQIVKGGGHGDYRSSCWRRTARRRCAT
jgi:2-oxoglutarate/2-oxoacid ferredoxin oxidoreductase subunit alpha